MNPNKAPGPDGIRARLIKNGGHDLIHMILDIINHMYREEVMPMNLAVVHVFPLHKKGNRIEWSS